MPESRPDVLPIATDGQRLDTASGPWLFAP